MFVRFTVSYVNSELQKATHPKLCPLEKQTTDYEHPTMRKSVSSAYSKQIVGLQASTGDVVSVLAFPGCYTAQIGSCLLGLLDYNSSNFQGSISPTLL